MSYFENIHFFIPSKVCTETLTVSFGLYASIFDIGMEQ